MKITAEEYRKMVAGGKDQSRPKPPPPEKPGFDKPSPTKEEKPKPGIRIKNDPIIRTSKDGEEQGLERDCSIVKWVFYPCPEPQAHQLMDKVKIPDALYQEYGPGFRIFSVDGQFYRITIEKVKID